MTSYKYIGMNRNSGLHIEDIEHIHQSISDILTTPQGTRVMRRDYGSLLSTLIDQPQNPALRLKMMAAVYGAVMRWEPRVTLNAISITTQIDGQMIVELSGSRTDSESRLSLAVPLGGQ
ncbi:GPW/gp25 family protein [Yersinia enterocolitica]|uniref:GPW/gp25 family protein n=1 Tax=Yersinia enterocolitica TaxID=630 RepID=UPI0005E87704|nr:GPW/gp25 family protein [Yersinia enterocolitica]EKN3573933.1 GPW/gp25 family protein [Yersinia enterocolitica]EKN4914358.1 baseplate assembly protein [Yersinia enterocolitica]CQJ13549.1 phage baseplate assembly protein W [Yersinia enterocolitica]